MQKSQDWPKFQQLQNDILLKTHIVRNRIIGTIRKLYHEGDWNFWCWNIWVNKLDHCESLNSHAVGDFTMRSNFAFSKDNLIGIILPAFIIRLIPNFAYLIFYVVLTQITWVLMSLKLITNDFSKMNCKLCSHTYIRYIIWNTLLFLFLFQTQFWAEIKWMNL